MPDYSNLGLTPNLQSVNSLANTGMEVRRAIDFDYQTERNSIGAMHVKNFNFSGGTGGTLTLGGNNNTRGQLVIENATGGTIITIGIGGIVLTGQVLALRESGGTQNKSYLYHEAAGGVDTLHLESLSNEIVIETDEQTVQIAAGKDMVLSFSGASGTNHFLAIKKDFTAAGTIARMDTAGNFFIAGTLGTGVSF